MATSRIFSGMTYKHVTASVAGASIPDPSGQPIPAAGIDVEWGSYWIALLNRGDITAYEVAGPGGGGGGTISPPVLSPSTVILMQVSGVNYPVTLAQLAAFLGASTTPGTGGAFDFSDPANSGHIPGL